MSSLDPGGFMIRRNKKRKSQKKLIALAAAAAGAASAQSASASLIAYEPFNYATLANGTASTATGTPTQTTGGGFSGNWSQGQGSISVVSGLTYNTGGTLPTTGSAITL